MTAKKQSTTKKKPWNSTPKRGSSTRYVKKHDSSWKAVKREPVSDTYHRSSKMGRVIDLPPGPSNIIVTTANPLPAPKKIGSN